MRVSERSRYQNVMHQIEHAKQQNARVLEKLSSQKQIAQIHENPAAAMSMVKINDRLQELSSFDRNVRFAKGFLDTTESAISKISERISRAQELAIAVSTDTAGKDSGGMTAQEIDGIIQQIVQLGNTQYNDKYIFAGFRSNTPAVSQNGVFLGDDGAIFTQLERDQFKRINIPGRFLFQANTEESNDGHSGLIDTLFVLKEGMETNNKDTIRKSLTELEFQANKVNNFQASIGAISNYFNDSEEQINMNKEKTTADLSQIRDIDIFEATSEFKRTEAALQSVLLASNKLLQPSLLNFMQ